MFSMLAWLTTYLAFFGATALIIRTDGQRQRQLKKARGEEDFVDRSVGPYMLFALISGALPLVFYFGATRKGVKGWLLGLGAALGTFVAVSVVGGLLVLGAGVLDGRKEHANNVQTLAKVEAACSEPVELEHAKDDPCRSLQTTYFAQAYSKADEKLEVEAYAYACDHGRAWACEWFSTAGIFHSVSVDEAQRELSQKANLCAKTPKLDGC